MKIVVIGGSGLIGSKLVAILRSKGHEVVAASPKSGVDTITGEGLAAALSGAAAVVDVANSPSFEDGPVMEFFRTSSRNLIAAEKAAGVRHHVALSVVGTDRLQASGYFRAKLVQEQLIEQSSVPFTIVRSTQFIEFVDRIIADGKDGESFRLSPALIQPIAADEVAAALADVATGTPQNGIVEIAGPEAFRITELARRIFDARKTAGAIVADTHARYFGAELNDASLMPGAKARLGARRFGDWLGQSSAPR